MRSRTDTEIGYRTVLEVPDVEQRMGLIRELAERDLYFLLTVVCRRIDARNDWVYERCREVQADPDGYLDLWAREHFKSSIITFGMTMFDIVRDPEITVGIFSHTRPIAKGFLRQFKREMEENPLLHNLWPGIFWSQSSREAPSWSEDSGLVLKRRSNPKEATIEAWGMVDGQPTSKHFRLRMYDDVVTRESVGTPEMIAKTTQAWELSLNLGTANGVARYAGTRYSHGDTYRVMIDRGAVKVREHPAEDEDGNPAYLSREKLDEKRRDMGPLTYAAQMLLRPTVDSLAGFQLAWLRYHDGIAAPGDGLNRFIIVDPAHSKRKGSDWTSIFVIGAGGDRNWHVCEMVRDRLNLTERIAAVMRLHRKWRPMAVGYERYGLQADIEAIKQRQAQDNYRFQIIELGGRLSKQDRINRLLPLFEQGRIWLPYTLHYTQYDGITVDLVHYFVNQEYLVYPASRYDDMLDGLSRICDEELNVIWPLLEEDEGDRYSRRRSRGGAESWMAA